MYCGKCKVATKNTVYRVQPSQFFEVTAKVFAKVNIFMSETLNVGILPLTKTGQWSAREANTFPAVYMISGQSRIASFESYGEDNTPPIRLSVPLNCGVALLIGVNHQVRPGGGVTLESLNNTYNILCVREGLELAGVRINGQNYALIIQQGTVKIE